MAKYHITEYEPGEDDIQPHNFVTIGGNLTQRQPHSEVEANDLEKQFRWLNLDNIPLELLNVYKNSTRSKPSDHQLVINSSSSKFKVTFLNGTLPTPPGKYNYYINYKIINNINKI